MPFRPSAEMDMMFCNFFEGNDMEKETLKTSSNWVQTDMNLQTWQDPSSVLENKMLFNV